MLAQCWGTLWRRDCQGSSGGVVLCPSGWGRGVSLALCGCGCKGWGASDSVLAMLVPGLNHFLLALGCGGFVVFSRFVAGGRSLEWNPMGW